MSPRPDISRLRPANDNQERPGPVRRRKLAKVIDLAPIRERREIIRAALRQASMQGLSTGDLIERIVRHFEIKAERDGKTLSAEEVLRIVSRLAKHIS